MKLLAKETPKSSRKLASEAGRRNERVRVARADDPIHHRLRIEEA